MQAQTRCWGGSCGMAVSQQQRQLVQQRAPPPLQLQRLCRHRTLLVVTGALQTQQSPPPPPQQQQKQQHRRHHHVASAALHHSEKERSRRFRRTTFDNERWVEHRSTSRYWRHIQSGLPSSRIVRGLAAPLTYVGVLSLLVTSYESARHAGVLPELFDGAAEWPSLAMPVTGPFSLSTFALSLLLVFRTNSSYQRWAEARKLWGLLINRSRDASRQVLQWAPAPADAGLAAAACRWLAAFPRALMCAVRADHTLRDALAPVLLPAELEYVLAQPHPGSAILQALGATVAATSSMREAHKLRVDENITALGDIHGGCERIYKTPIPLSYTRHTSRFLVCWVSLLPFCVADDLGLATVPVAVGLAFFLLGIEEIGVQIEEPFGILPLETFCQTISANVQQAQHAAAAARANAAAAAAAGAAAAPSAAAIGQPVQQQQQQRRAAAPGPVVDAATLLEEVASGIRVPGDAAGDGGSGGGIGGSILATPAAAADALRQRPRAGGAAVRPRSPPHRVTASEQEDEDDEDDSLLLYGGSSSVSKGAADCDSFRF